MAGAEEPVLRLCVGEPGRLFAARERECPDHLLRFGVDGRNRGFVFHVHVHPVRRRVDDSGFGLAPQIDGGDHLAGGGIDDGCDMPVPLKV